MDIVNKSKALNLLIPRLINKSNNMTKEIRTRIRLNNIFSEFENKASNNLNYFITASNQRYNSIKLGNDLDSILSNSRPKNINEATKIVTDNFYLDKDVENERKKMKYKSAKKIYKDIKDTFTKMKLSLDNKNSKENDRQIQLILRGVDTKKIMKPKPIIIKQEKPNKVTIINYNNEENFKRNNNIINDEFEKEQNSIEETIKKYMNNLNNNINKIPAPHATVPTSNTPAPHKKQTFQLPNLKLVTYKQYKPPKKKPITEEEKKPNIRKLLPYSKLSKNFEYNKMLNEESTNKEEKNKNCPFITEPDLKLKNNKNYHNTLSVVYNSANNEFLLENKFDNKRRKLEKMLGVNDIPEINTYDDIAVKKSERIKYQRHRRAKKISDSQNFALLSRRAKINRIIENDMELLDKLESKIYTDDTINKSL